MLFRRSGGGRRGELQAGQLGFGEQGAEDLPVVLAEGDGSIELGGHALELAEVVQAQAEVEALRSRPASSGSSRRPGGWRAGRR
jgi:hypothetical protein